MFSGVFRTYALWSLVDSSTSVGRTQDTLGLLASHEVKQRMEVLKAVKVISMLDLHINTLKSHSNIIIHSEK